MKKINILTVAGVITVLLTSFGAIAEGEAVSADDFLKDQAVSGNASSNSVDIIPEKTVALTEIEKSIALAKAELDDKEILTKKISLAREMHQIRPTRDQVDAAVSRVALSFPPHERRSFVNAMTSMLNYNAIERISIDAMIETYTLKELSSMVEYYSKPEAISASDKMISWAKLIQPDVANMIDKAVMRIKTGQ